MGAESARKLLENRQVLPIEEAKLNKRIPELSVSLNIQDPRKITNLAKALRE